MTSASRDVPLAGMEYAAVEALNEPYDAARVDRLVGVDVEQANIITSKVAGSDKHKVVIDLDLPAKLLSSSTPGHFHLFIDHEVTWGQYEALLLALAAAGIVEEGYVGASLKRGYTAVRLPWVRKPNVPAKQESGFGIDHGIAGYSA